MKKNNVLRTLARLIDTHQEAIIEQNKKDLRNARNVNHTLIDRLKVNKEKIENIVHNINSVINIEDPVGKVVYEYTHPNGMLVQNKTVPFGRILIIYESRPDVTIEAAISAFKADNTVLLKGGKEARNSNQYLVELWHSALKKHGYSTEVVTYVDWDRNATQGAIKTNTPAIDLIIPRGGEQLIQFVKENAASPVIISGRGNNFVYIHQDADIEMTVNIISDGKKRLSVCNAVDKVLIHKKHPEWTALVKAIIERLRSIGIKIHAGQNIQPLYPECATLIQNKQLYYQEFLSADILIDDVESVEQAIESINLYSGGHSSVIVCKDDHIASIFQEQVDSAAVYWNVSSRFTDGGQFGLGTEMAISTQKTHFRGPVSVPQLVTNKWFITGDGQIRQ